MTRIKEILIKTFWKYDMIYIVSALDDTQVLSIKEESVLKG